MRTARNISHNWRDRLNAWPIPESREHVSSQIQFVLKGDIEAASRRDRPWIEPKKAVGTTKHTK
jgi:hypothetical protein